MELGSDSGAGAGRWGLPGGEGSDELRPGGEDEVGGDGAQVLEEAPARTEGLAGFFPCGFEDVAQAVASEGQEVMVASRAARFSSPWPKLCSRL